MKINEIDNLTPNDKRGLDNLDRILRRESNVDQIVKKLENIPFLSSINPNDQIEDFKIEFMHILRQEKKRKNEGRPKSYLNDPQRVLLRFMSEFNDKMSKLSKILKKIEGKPTEYEGSFKDGMASLKKVQPRKIIAILKALPLIEIFGAKSKVTWKTMKWSLIITRGRGGYILAGLGSNVVITGNTRNGTEIKYIYKQPRAQEGGQRMYKIGNSCLFFISRLEDAKWKKTMLDRKKAADEELRLRQIQIDSDIR